MQIVNKFSFLVTVTVAAALPAFSTSQVRAEVVAIERFTNEIQLSLLADPAPPANLGSFNIVISPGATLAGNAPALAAFNRAAVLWENFIADPITVTIAADLAPLPTGVLGSASSSAFALPYTTVRDAMVADAVGEADDGIVASLPTLANFTSTLDGGGLAGNGGSITWNGNLSATSANWRALGLTHGAIPSDASITFTTTAGITFDFDNSDGVTPGAFDFETVAAHEIGHALGWTSNIDTIDAMQDTGAGGITAGAVSIRTMDMFRFADGTASDPANATDFSTFQRNQTPGAVTVFDEVTQQGIPGAEALLSTGVSQGDGQQASHLKDLLGLGLLDPTLSPGTVVPISTTDLRVLDLVGYEILAPIPEPSVLFLLLGGLGGLALRRRRR